MKKAISVVLADSSDGFRKLLSEYIDAEEDMYVAAAAENGMEAVERVSALRPDVLITDLLLREMEGLSLIRSLKEVGDLPHTIVVSGFFNDRLAVKAGELGVERFLPKPCSVDSLIECIRDCVCPGDTGAEKQRREEKRRLRVRLENRVDEALSCCGVMPHLRGWRYLRMALVLIAEDREKLLGVTKILYPELAAHFGTDATNVERCIRNAVELAWRDGDARKRAAYLGPAMSGALERRPGNVRFMKMVIERLECGEGTEE